MLSNNKWIADRKPNSGAVFEEKKKDKYAYRYCIRQKKNKQTGDISNSLHDSLLSKNSQCFWKTWKSKLGSKTPLPRFINGKTGDSDISNEFATSFSNACNFNSP